MFPSALPLIRKVSCQGVMDGTGSPRNWPLMGRVSCFQAQEGTERPHAGRGVQVGHPDPCRCPTLGHHLCTTLPRLENPEGPFPIPNRAGLSGQRRDGELVKLKLLLSLHWVLEPRTTGSAGTHCPPATSPSWVTCLSFGTWLLCFSVLPSPCRVSPPPQSGDRTGGSEVDRSPWLMNI